ncbi:hypothetical protein HII31_12484 [Pseudocercospora fuligena]|uniref:Uncharacterized protein n=1 Tax=Pseudocercospora fuligena TaxID=685502 RepID=A0A8H6VD25_9PEZI|nr:hypothetical protein HII31_12484 [Pseudocercospora fuligena]
MVADRDQSTITPTSTSKKRDRDDNGSPGSAEKEAMLSPSVRKAPHADSKNARGDKAVTAQNQPDDTPSRTIDADKKRVQRKTADTMDLTGDEYNSPPTTPTSSASKVRRKQKAPIQKTQNNSTAVTPLKIATPKPLLDMTPVQSTKKQAAEDEGVRGPVHTRHITPKKGAKKGKNKKSDEQTGSSDPSAPLPSFGKDYQLQFKSIAEAWPEPRLGIVIPQEDDIEEVERNASSWVKTILQALVDPAQAPYTESKHCDGARWQQSLASHQTQVNNWVASNVRESERRAWLLLGQVISLQKEGFTSDTKGRTDNDSMFRANFRYDKILCSERLERIVAVIKEYSIIALEVLQLKRTDLFVAVPEATENEGEGDEFDRGDTPSD